MKADAIHVLQPAALLSLLVLLAGCASAPQPASCRGEFRPVNREVQMGALPDAAERLAMCDGGRHGQG